MSTVTWVNEELRIDIPHAELPNELLQLRRIMDAEGVDIVALGGVVQNDGMARINRSIGDHELGEPHFDEIWRCITSIVRQGQGPSLLIEFRALFVAARDGPDHIIDALNVEDPTPPRRFRISYDSMVIISAQGVIRVEGFADSVGSD